MSIKSRAVVIPRRNVVEIRTVQVTEPRAGDVLIRTAYTSISAGTERMLLDGRLPQPQLLFPVVPGYETVGQVVQTGKKAPKDLLGQWVYVGGARCFQGVNPAWGGQSEFISAEADRVVPLKTIDPATGVILALAATALHGINVAHIRPSDRVLVLGQGIVGQVAARLAKLAGASYVAVADRVAVRLEKSKADQVVDINRESLDEAISDANINVIVEATGSMTALAGALPLLANHGRVLLLGYYDTINVPYAPLFMREAQLLIAREWQFGPDGDLPRARDLIASGELDVSGLLTHHVPLDRIQAAYRLAFEDPACLKVVVEWPKDDVEC
ncbi:zinc-binding dehydrogenase [Oscillochloris sp. ZM17-4]|uniref:zinc-binding dehydrogenase n=1 Tax=Oscillochloris sp. ZM17-4 TaxID=2866714 RepID=UPI001C732BC8|nr:zinc-binding dehydrogenase [Oscillochloris sp. ZM17-4]MBX0326167.1 zinc-binding dehydrogenase [Oscillochloris sp. ZM17-4]